MRGARAPRPRDRSIVRCNCLLAVGTPLIIERRRVVVGGKNVAPRQPGEKYCSDNWQIECGDDEQPKPTTVVQEDTDASIAEKARLGKKQTKRRNKTRERRCEIGALQRTRAVPAECRQAEDAHKPNKTPDKDKEPGRYTPVRNESLRHQQTVNEDKHERAEAREEQRRDERTPHDEIG